jgi:hypothetical protein
MNEEKKDQREVEKEAPLEEAEPVEAEPVEAEPGPQVEEAPSAGQLAEGPKASWTVPVVIIAAILALCALVVCITAAITALSGGRDETPAPTAAPVPTWAPSRAMIAITEPDQGQVVEIDQPVRVQGEGVGLPEGNVVVQALDWQGNVLAQQPTTLQGRDVGTRGEGTWSVELTIEAEPARRAGSGRFPPPQQMAASSPRMWWR